MDDGGVIVGNKGEKLTNHYSFYAVFQDENGWHVFYRDAEIGTLDNCPKQDEVFTLSGRCWKVADIDEERRNIFAVPAKTRRIISWHGSGGEIHSRVAQRIKKILHENAQYPYLGENAISYLAEARKLSQESGILERGYHFEGKTVILMPWCGTKIAKSKDLLVGQQPKPIDRTQSARLFCAMFTKHTRTAACESCSKGFGVLPQQVASEGVEHSHAPLATTAK